MQGPGDLCESISKIIRFTVATHFRLPPPIMALSGEDDRLQLHVEQGPLLFNPSLVPPETSIPLLSSISPHHLHGRVPGAAAYITDTGVPFVEMH